MSGVVTDRAAAMARLRWTVVLLSAAGAFASFGSLAELYVEGTWVAVGVGLAASVLAFVAGYSVLLSNLVLAHGR